MNFELNSSDSDGRNEIEFGEPNKKFHKKKCHLSRQYGGISSNVYL